MRFLTFLPPISLPVLLPVLLSVLLLVAIVHPAYAESPFSYGFDMNVSIDEKEHAKVIEKIEVKSEENPVYLPALEFHLSNRGYKHLLNLFPVIREKRGPLDIHNMTASLDGVEIEPVMWVEGNTTLISLPVNVTIPPESAITVTYSYGTNDLVSPILLFKEVNIPITAIDYPTYRFRVTVSIPPGNFVTYSGEEITVKEYTEMSYISSNLSAGDTEYLFFEYTKLPMPRLPFQGSKIFWVLLIFLIVIWMLRHAWVGNFEVVFDRKKFNVKIKNNSYRQKVFEIRVVFDEKSSRGNNGGKDVSRALLPAYRRIFASRKEKGKEKAKEMEFRERDIIVPAKDVLDKDIYMPDMALSGKYGVTVYLRDQEDDVAIDKKSFQVVL